jgi:hypothetical protein
MDLLYGVKTNHLRGWDEAYLLLTSKSHTSVLELHGVLHGQQFYLAVAYWCRHTQLPCSGHIGRTESWDRDGRGPFDSRFLLLYRLAAGWRSDSVLDNDSAGWLYSQARTQDFVTKLYSHSNCNFRINSISQREVPRWNFYIDAGVCICESWLPSSLREVVMTWLHLEWSTRRVSNLDHGYSRQHPVTEASLLVIHAVLMGVQFCRLKVALPLLLH